MNNDMLKKDSERGGLFSTIVSKISSIEEWIRNHKSVKHPNPPTTTALSDFQVGDGSGSWIKKTLAEVKTILGIVTMDSGTWTPTLYNTTNITSSNAYDGQYIRVGNVVFGTMWLEADPTAAGSCVLGFQLPVASAFTDNRDLTGLGVSTVVATPEIYICVADATNDRGSIQWTAGDTTNHSFFIHFSYQII